MDEYLAEIRLFAGTFAPRNWAFCEGQILAISSNNALFALLGTTYGGDGRTTFSLPDCRGRVPLHTGSGPGLAYISLGQKGGIESNTLNINNLPSHNHDLTIQVSGEDGEDTTPVDGFLAKNENVELYTSANNANMNAGSITLTDAGAATPQPVTNIQPTIALNYIICIQGSFPSRS